MDEYILFSRNEEGGFEIKIPFSGDSLNQVSELLAKEGVLVQKDEIKGLQDELGELKSMVAEVRRENSDLANLLKDILTGIRESETKASPTPLPPRSPESRKGQDFAVPESKISMLPSARTKAYKLISDLAKEHMDEEFNTGSLTLYEKRVFSLLVKRYEFVQAVRKEGRSIIYRFNDRALQAICQELGGMSTVSVRSRMRSKSLEEYLGKMKARYPHFAFKSTQGGSTYRQFKLLFTDKSVKKSVVGNITRTFGPSSVKAG